MLKESLDALSLEVAALAAKVEAAKAELDAELKAAYDKGFEDGAKSIGSDVIYTQAEVDALVAAALAPVVASNQELLAQVAALPEKIEAAKAELKASLKAALEAELAEEAALEAKLLDLLK